MAKTEGQSTAPEQVAVSEDENNNNDSKCPENASGFSSVKYQLRPRSLKSRRLSDSDWNLQEALSHKPRAAPPLSRYRRKTANARERYRMRQINSAFESLRGVLPSWVCRRRTASELTKISMLRLASDYIRSLQDILDGSAHQDTCSWVLSSLLGDAQSPEESQPLDCNSSTESSPSKSQQPLLQAPQDSELMSLLSGGASEPGVLQEDLESSYLAPLPDADAFGLWLGYDQPRCWSETQHTLPVS